VVSNYTKFYIGGRWVEPSSARFHDVVNAATEQVTDRISLGSSADVDLAVRAARIAFESYSQTTVEYRLDLLQKVIEGYVARREELSQAMTLEMGTPITFSRQVQSAMALFHFEEMVRVLKTYEFEKFMGTTLIRREPIGVCGAITPWNWPLSQVTAKVAPALAAGCAVVLKPSEIAPFSSILLAEILHDAGVPAGVFNLINGDGPTVGEAIAGHPGIDMVSFTGSTRAGVRVAKAAADSVKRVTQELGGKSPNIVLPSADLEKAVSSGVLACYINAGQSCQAPTRMLVHRSQKDAALNFAKQAAERLKIGLPSNPDTQLGPLVSQVQFDKVQDLIASGIEQGATLVCGGTGRPEGFEKGFFVRPTVFADVTAEMRIAREEVFGPVLAIQFYDTEDEAVSIANDTDYGLAGFVQAGTTDEASKVASRIRAGRVYLNGATVDRTVPFGGYKHSGNGREYGVFGFEEYLEVKAVLGARAAA
jgi:aldehyde dehydrogenase (NAD+)